MSTIHKRETIVRQANLEWIKFYMEWVEKHELTDGELLGIFAREIASISKWTIRHERHPGHEDRPGGLE